ncbi:thymidylate synthase [Sphaerimonospora thailandensis]|uniref:Thymidylate synthase n=1 Tax=Sphaerimonospora thailandensis TaxID=795644 RepID=A0A8J3R7C0_9ACTN|nr:thymidylate synthase [Sphaerimonospora thailandensis]GIH69141.1 thymidylate synthase [Sphaerimonospora thailandensis]
MTPPAPVGLPTFATFHDAYRAVLHRILTQPNYTASARGKTFSEILGAGFTLTDPRHRIPYLVARRPNIVFNYAEALWYLAGRDDLDMIAYYAPRLRALSADGQHLTGTAYGPRLFTPPGASQWDHVVDLLRRDAGSKRAAMVIMRPTELADPGNPDVACTLALQFLLRDGALHTVAFMRGNDAWIGLACDVFSFTVIAEYTAQHLGVPLGTYTHLVSSMHLAVADLPRAEATLAETAAPALDPPTMPPTGPDTLATVLEWEQRLRTNDSPLNPKAADVAMLDPYWQHVLALFEVHRQIVHQDGTVSGGVLDTLPALYRWLLAQRWPGRIPPLYIPAVPNAAPVQAVTP